MTQFLDTIINLDNDPSRTREEKQHWVLSILRENNTGMRWSRSFFIFDKGGICLVSQDQKEFEGLSIEQIQQPGDDITSLFLDLQKGGEPRFVSHTFPAVNEIGTITKTDYIAYFEPWGWIVGSGFLSSGADSSLEGQRLLWEEFREDVLRTVILRLLVFSFLLYLFILIATQLLRSSHRTRLKIQKSLAMYKEALEDNLCVMLTDVRGEIQYVNEMYCRVTGYEKKELKGESFSHYYDPDRKVQQENDVKKTLLNGQTWHGELKGRDKKGDPFWLQAYIKPIRDDSGEITGFIAVGLDVTELHRTKRHLETSNHIDSLTGCGNRAKLLADYDRMESALVAFFNIDRFSSINRFYGMEKGDEALTMITRELTSHLRDGENLYRIHADTFAILKGGNDSSGFIENCRAQLKALQKLTFTFDGHDFPTSFRAGISTSSTDTMVLADSALSAAKENPDGIVIYSDKELDNPRHNQEKLERLNMLRQALDQSRIFLVYQPIIDLQSGVIRKYECLMRLKDEEGNTVSPGNFINLAKESRLYKKLTSFVIKRAFREFHDRDEDFSINLTIEDFSDRETIDLLIGQARYYQVQKRLILELVETEELRDFEGIINIIDRLKAEGIRIAIDDFGSGFSNFTYLLKLNADYIKIDGSLIKNIQNDEKNYSLVTSIIQFARDAGIKTIAEYIETEQLMNFTRGIGIDFGQGYFIGKPDEKIPSILKSSN